MIEESLPTFELCCKHIDAASLSADTSRTRQYVNVINQYAGLAKGGNTAVTTTQALPTSVRFRMIALRAIRAVVGSDALGVVTTDQLHAVMPVILENLDLEKAGSLGPLQQRANTGEKQSAEFARKRRMSTVTVPSIDETTADPAMASETTADADKLAEEEVRILAIRCLKQIFSVSTGSNRTQMRVAMTLVLKYIASKERPQSRSNLSFSQASDWATTLFETIARWTPVQDRFVIVIVTVESLVRSPIVESILEKQLVLATLIDWLLKSDINLIGLSVMDVLLRLIQHTLVLLQLGSRDSTAAPQHGAADTLGLYKDISAPFEPTELTTVTSKEPLADSKEATPSPVRKELLHVLQKCISDLATHIYYTDQISDMLTAILARLKPSTTSDIPSAVAAINDPAGATKAISDSADLQEDPSTDGFFSFATARVVALKAVKEIIQTANSRRTGTGTSAEVRSRVGITVWDGTQWLLKDDEPEVRAAYIEAVITWLRLETNKSDQLLPSDGPKKVRHSKKETENHNGDLSIAKRAVSNASRKGEKQKKSPFLQLLHLAIYDDAVERADSDISIGLLFSLLWTLVERLGMNAVRAGLPMILNLQGNVLSGNDHNAVEKARVASLVHGYLWTIADKFDFEATAIGTELNSEMARRKKFGSWWQTIKFPPQSISSLSAVSAANPDEISEEGVNNIRPFLNVNAFVDELAKAYETSLLSPPSSPSLSPGRVFSVPTLGFGYGFSAAPTPKPSRDLQVPQKIKEEMCGSWSREACIASVDKESNPSITGSRTAPSSIGKRYLSAGSRNNGASGPPTPQDAEGPHLPLVSGLGSLTRARDMSTSSSLRDAETSSRDSTMRVSDLKRALSGVNGQFRGHSPLRRPISRSRQSTRSSDSDSMVSWNPADDDSFVEVDGQRTRPGTAISQAPNLTVHDRVTVPSTGQRGSKPDNDIPPVPKIPSTLNLPMAGTWPRDASPVRPPQTTTRDHALPQTQTDDFARPGTNSANTLPRSIKQRPMSRAGGNSIRSHGTAGRKVDLTALLATINVDEPAKNATRDVSAGSVRSLKPPY